MLTSLKKIILILMALAFLYPAGAEARNSTWAQPITMGGVNNLYKVDDNLYRSEQPNAQGFKSLEAFGVKTVVSLRASKIYAKAASGTNLNPISIPIVTWEIVDEDVAKALSSIKNSEAPIFMHCRHGADRTGLIMALHRVIYQVCSKEEAKDEMLNIGYGFHSIWTNIPEYLDAVDVEKLQAMIK